MLSQLGLKDRLLRILWVPVRTATKRASGGKSLNNSTAGRRLGRKAGEGEFVNAGTILWRQRGTVWYPGENAGIGRDHTIFAKEPGFVRFYRDPFHAKRKFIGVALGSEERLPTPHFEPRRRRFGRKEIDNETVAEFEREYISKKETELLLTRQQSLKSREQRRGAVKEKTAAELKEIVPQLNEIQLVTQTERFMEIRQYMHGSGLSFTEARQTVDQFSTDDLATDVRVGRVTLEQFNSAIEEVNKMNQIVDSKAMITHNGQIAPYVSPEDQASARDMIIEEIKQLTTNVDAMKGTPDEVVAKIERLLARPAFDAAQAMSVRRRYVLKPRPVLIQDNSREEYTKLIASGMGTLKKVWNHSDRKAEEFYVPNGAALIF